MTINKLLLSLMFLVYSACASSSATEKFRAIPSTKDNLIKIEYGKQTATIPLDIEKNFEIENFITTPAKDFQVIAYQYAGDSMGASTIVMYDPKNLKELWRYQLEGFNMAIPFVDGAFVYVAAVGHVAKLDIASGKAAWEHKDLYEKYEFNAGESISKKDGFIYFSDSFKVEDKSGKIGGGGK